jgi:hypothetical protein
MFWRTLDPDDRIRSTRHRIVAGVDFD